MRQKGIIHWQCQGDGGDSLYQRLAQPNSLAWVSVNNFLPEDRPGIEVGNGRKTCHSCCSFSWSGKTHVSSFTTFPVDYSDSGAKDMIPHELWVSCNGLKKRKRPVGQVYMIAMDLVNQGFQHTGVYMLPESKTFALIRWFWGESLCRTISCRPWAKPSLGLSFLLCEMRVSTR